MRSLISSYQNGCAGSRVGDIVLGPSWQIVVMPGGHDEAGREVVAEPEQQVEVLGAAVAVRHPVEHLLDPARALTARRALAARLVGEELGDAPRDQQRVDGLVEHHDRPGAEHRS